MTIRINMSYGEEVNLIVMRKKTCTYNVFNKLLSVTELLYLGQLHISEQRYPLYYKSCVRCRRLEQRREAPTEREAREVILWKAQPPIGNSGAKR